MPSDGVLEGGQRICGDPGTWSAGSTAQEPSQARRGVGAWPCGAGAGATGTRPKTGPLCMRAEELAQLGRVLVPWPRLEAHQCWSPSLVPNMPTAPLDTWRPIWSCGLPGLPVLSSLRKSLDFSKPVSLSAGPCRLLWRPGKYGMQGAGRGHRSPVVHQQFPWNASTTPPYPAFQTRGHLQGGPQGGSASFPKTCQSGGCRGLLRLHPAPSTSPGTK